MVDQEEIKKAFEKKNVLELLKNIPYKEYYPKNRCDVFVEKVNSKYFTSVNCKDSIHEGASFEELVIRYKFTFELFISETDPYKCRVLEDELKIIKGYMAKCLGECG